MRHEMLRGRHDHQPWLTSNHASPLATRKQIEPTMSGTQTSRCAWVALRLVSMAATRRDVEEHGADELHRARRPVDAGGLPRPEAEALATSRRTGARSQRVRRVQGLQVLQVGRGGEEERADEERHRVGVGADPVDVPRQGADGEARRADGEEHADPPADRGRSPPRAPATGVEAAGLLPVRPRAPLHLGAVRPAEPLTGDERPHSGCMCARPARRRHDVGTRQDRQPRATG